jgi:hypothetical protein
LLPKKNLILHETKPLIPCSLIQATLLPFAKSIAGSKRRLRIKSKAKVQKQKVGSYPEHCRTTTTVTYCSPQIPSKAQTPSNNDDLWAHACAAYPYASPTILVYRQAIRIYIGIAPHRFICCPQDLYTVELD